MIRIEQLSKTYTSGAGSIPALSDIHLDIERGEIFGIIGRSGAGKSTLLRTLNLLEKPDAGRILIDGQDILQLRQAGLRALRQKIGMIFQHFNLLNAKTVAENIDWPLKITGNYSRAERARRVDELLQLVGLAAQRNSYPAQLSGGQKQRVGIARALANSPTLLLCDEATSALDPETTQSILALLLEINRTLGLTIVLITHEMQVIRTLCDRVAVIDRSVIVESGAVAEVFLFPKHAVTRKLVAESQNASQGSATSLAAVPGARVRLTLTGAVVLQPVFQQMSAVSTARLTLLEGSVGSIKDTPYAQWVVGIAGSDDAVRELFTWFDQHAIHHEVLS